MRKATKMQETAFELKPVVHGLEMVRRDRARTDQLLVKGRLLQTLGESGCLHSRDGLQISFHKRLRMNISGIFRDLVPELQYWKR